MARLIKSYSPSLLSRRIPARYPSLPGIIFWPPSLGRAPKYFCNKIDPHETSVCALRRLRIRDDGATPNDYSDHLHPSVNPRRHAAVRARRTILIGQCETLTPAGAIIQVGPPFAGHLHTLPGVLAVGTGPVHYGDWKFAAQGQSQVVAPSVSLLPRHVLQAHSSLPRYEVRRGYSAALAMPSLPITVLHHSGQQRNERAQSLAA